MKMAGRAIAVGMFVVAVLAIAAPSQAAMKLQFNFGNTAYSGNQSPGAQQGDFLSTDTAWNLTNTPGYTNPVQADGTPTSGVTVQTARSFASGLAVWGIYGIDGVYSASSPDAFYNNNGLMTHLGYSASDSIGVRVSGLAIGSYRVYIMAFRGDQPANISTMYVGLNLDKNYVTQQPAPLTLGPASNSDSSWGNGVNYASQVVTVTSTSDWLSIINGTSGTPILNGVQIFSLPVPEPATMALLALGGLALLRRRRE